MDKTILIKALGETDGIMNYIIYLENNDGVKIQAVIVTGEEDKEKKINEMMKLKFIENITI